MSRREFSRAVKLEIIKRATRDGMTFCEGCGCLAKRWHIDHTSPDGLQIDKSKPLTAADGKLLCAGSRDTCHGRKTAEQDVPAIALVKRQVAAHLGADKPNTQKIAQKAKPVRSTFKQDQIASLRAADYARRYEVTNNGE